MPPEALRAPLQGALHAPAGASSRPQGARARTLEVLVRARKGRCVCSRKGAAWARKGRCMGPQGELRACEGTRTPAMGTHARLTSAICGPCKRHCACPRAAACHAHSPGHRVPHALHFAHALLYTPHFASYSTLCSTFTLRL